MFIWLSRKISCYTWLRNFCRSRTCALSKRSRFLAKLKSWPVDQTPHLLQSDRLTRSVFPPKYQIRKSAAPNSPPNVHQLSENTTGAIAPVQPLNSGTDLVHGVIARSRPARNVLFPCLLRPMPPADCLSRLQGMRLFLCDEL